MSRSGYHDDWSGDEWRLIMWRGTVASAVRGKRGQAFLQALVEALDALPEKRLARYDLRRPDGSVCALGSVLVARGQYDESLELPDDDWVDEWRWKQLAEALDIAPALAREIMFINDYEPSDEARWRTMRRWAVEQLRG